MEVCSLYFCVMPAGIRNADFFEGIAGHLQLDESGKEADARFSGWFSEWSADEDLSEMILRYPVSLNEDRAYERKNARPESPISPLTCLRNIFLLS